MSAGIHKTTPTEKACLWNNFSRTKAEPAKIKDLNFYKPKVGIASRIKTCFVGESVKTVPPLEKDEFLELQDVASNCALFRHVNCENVSDSDTDSDAETVRDSFCGDLSKLYNPSHRSLSDADLEEVINETFDKCFACSSLSLAANIESNTKNENETWHALRVGRITSTKCHAILTRRQTTSTASIIKSIMGYTTVPVSKEMALGLQMEESIRQKYIF